MRSRSEVNSGIHVQQPVTTTFVETAAVCQILPQPTRHVHVEDIINTGKTQFSCATE